jgi:hypothetical protein
MPSLLRRCAWVLCATVRIMNRLLIHRQTIHMNPKKQPSTMPEIPGPPHNPEIGPIETPERPILPEEEPELVPDEEPPEIAPEEQPEITPEQPGPEIAPNTPL